MTIREEFTPIFSEIQAGRPTVRSLVADGETYSRNFFPDERLIILGSGHIAQPLCRYAADLGFSVTVADDRPSFANTERFPDARTIVVDDFSSAISGLAIGERDYVCILTRGHRFDADCLRAILPGTYPKYLGMIGSRRRVHDLKNMLEAEGYSREKLDAICTPIGLDINAITAKEIAVSIVAQLIQYRRMGVDRHRAGTQLIEENTAEDVIRSVLDPTPKVLLTVYQSHGSTPVRSGAMMTVDGLMRTVGTIGGGCSEGAVMLDAVHMIGTGTTRTMHVDMSNDVAAEEGMVCGGSIDVLMEDVT